MIETLGILDSEPPPDEESDFRLPALALASPPPRFAMVRKSFPEESFLFSCVIHASVLAVLPIFFPPVHLVPTFLERMVSLDLVNYQQALLLPALGDTGDKAGSSESANKDASKASPSDAGAAPRQSLATFSGPQEIISDTPDATNTLQTIRRPDLVTPIRIKDPIRLQSKVQLPTPPIVRIAPTPLNFIAQPAPMPVAMEVTSNAVPVAQPVLVVRRSEKPPQLVETAPPNVIPNAHESTPALSAPVGNAPTLAKAIVVINAVDVPPDPNVSVPDAELSGRFRVAQLQTSVTPPSAHGGVSGGVSNSDAAKPGPGKTGAASGNGATLVAGGIGSGGAANPGSGAGIAVGSGTGAGTRAGTGASGNGGVGNGKGPGFAGISIAGGVGGSGNGSVHSSAGLSHSYGLTVISSGNSGGPSHDLGVFTRNETVYTVYLPMRDEGGGPDWSMQYALTQSSSSNGLLNPPYPVKKIRAELPLGDSNSDPNPVFIVGTIDVDGKLQSLRAARAGDARSASAIAALGQWQFSAAKLDGKPVTAKVLIGVMLVTGLTTAGGTR